MFFSKYRLSNLKGLTYARGPEIPDKPNITIKFSDCILNLKAPKHRAPSHVPQVRPPEHFELTSHMKHLIYDKPGWRAECVLARQYDFYGPRFTGKLGSVATHVDVLEMENNEQSLLNPRAFEIAIADVLRYRYYHPEIENDFQNWFGPINWNQKASGSAQGANFYVIANQRKLKLYDCLTIPLTNKHMLYIYNYIERINVFTDTPTKAVDDLEEWVSIDPFLDFSKQIIDSIEVKYTPPPMMNGGHDLRENQFLLSRDYAPIKWVEDSPIYTPYLLGISNKH